MAVVSEELVCEREPHKSHNRYAVAVKRMGIITGHLPQKLKSGSIFCTVSGGRRYFHHLLQGGLKIYCLSTSPKNAQVCFQKQAST